MLKALATSCVFALLAAQANAQVPLTTDTLPNGKKVSNDSFIGRFSVYTEVGGPIGLIGSMNVGYALVKREGWLLDYNLGLSTLPIPGVYFHPNKFMLPTGLSLQIGRRKSRLNVKLGYSFSWTPGYDKSPWPECAGTCPTPPQHLGSFSLGYVYQHHHGFFFGVNAYGLIQFNSKELRASYIPRKDDIYPWGGITFGYRIPSTKQLQAWKHHRGGKVLRKMGIVPEKSFANQDSLPLEMQEPTTFDLVEIALELEQKEKKRLLWQQKELRDNGPSNIYIEALGAGFFWSANYQYTTPIKPNSLVHAFGRIGVGGAGNRAFGSSSILSTPVGGGIQLLKKYRGGGIGAGVSPTLGRGNEFALVSYISFDLQFHISDGVTFGAGYQIMFDPERVHNGNQVFQWGGFSVGYRLLRKKKAIQ
jgi:hypothetical protein